jgi:hypothetical protein
MRHPTLPLVLALMLTTTALAGEYPLSQSKLTLRVGSPGKPGVNYSGKWSGSLDGMDPGFQGATLRITGATGEGGSPLISLARGSWRAKKSGFVFVDKHGVSGGIRKVVLKAGKNGKPGVVRIVGGKGFDYEYLDEHSQVVVTFQVGDNKWCAVIAEPSNKKGKVSGKTATPPTVCPCEAFDHTWQAIQKVIIEGNGCTQPICHGSAEGAASSGGLDLRPDVAYDSLVNVASTRSTDKRVERGSRQDSFLWRKLAASTLGEPLASDEGAAMPSALPAISEDELEALRLWIQIGAPETGVVPGVEDLLAVCQPKSNEPPKIVPPDPPAPGEGVQLVAPGWVIPPAEEGGADGEGEVCYATYHNLADQIPDQYKTPCPAYWGGPSKTCFYSNRDDLAQDPNSHHSIIHIYNGERDVTHPGFDFRCHVDHEPGARCDPRVANPCPNGGQCYGAVKNPSLACINYGPDDFSASITGNGSSTAPTVGGSQQPFARNVFPNDVYRILPAEHVMVWNSHAFNLYDVPTTNEQYWNIYFFDPPDERLFARGIFEAQDIFIQNVPPFQEREYCRTTTMPIGTRMIDLSSHVHERGRLFRTWGPPIANACSSRNDPSCKPEDREPLVVATEYNDPTIKDLDPNDPAWQLDDPNPANRRFKFCAVFDNGFNDPSAVKLNSESPNPPGIPNLCNVGGGGGFLPAGGKCFFGNPNNPTDCGIACVNAGKRGVECHGDDRVCDSSPGANDGICDACPLRGGVTTEDEMFILIGTYYCQPGTPCAGTQPGL